jgi:GNAT superfamily N-acetyltransferase
MPSTSSRINVRPAGAADVDQLCQLLALLFTQEADFSPDVERQARGLTLILDQPRVGRIYCACDGDTVVGMVSILFTVSTAEGGPVAWLEDMVVRPSHRNQGIGEALLQKAVAGARDSGCTRITLLTDAVNRSAMRFYERAGFVPSAMTPFRLSLSGSPRVP